MQYALVTQDGMELYCDIPESFRNVSGFHHLTDEERKQYGFYRIVERTNVGPETKFDPMFHSHSEIIQYEPGTDSVVRITTITVLSIPEIKTNLLQALGERRYVVEIGGMTLPNGVAVETNRESQAMITQAVASMRNGYLTYVDFKASNGWIQLDLPSLDYIGSETAKHVQRCFTIEKTKASQINAMTTVEELMAYDLNAGWFGAAFTRTYKNATV